jgi:threonine dehydratase
MKTTSLKKDIISAYERINQYIIKTPLIKAESLSQITNANVYFKLENVQLTGSFKVRGAFNKLLSMEAALLKKGVIAASSGNHGAAVAYACRELGIFVQVFVPENTPSNKVQNINLFGAEVIFYGKDGGITEIKARAEAKEKNIPYISPYNDYDVICGQGTIGYEIDKQIDKADEVYIAVGGGGLISGVGSYIKATHPHADIMACLPDASPVMYESIRQGEIVDCDNKPTLSDGTAGNLDADSITFELCEQLIDDFRLVSEDEIKEAMRFSLEKEHMLVEGSAGVAIAAVLQNKNDLKNKNIVIVVCGGNVSIETLSQVLDE